MGKEQWFTETVVSNESKLIRYTQRMLRTLEASREIVQECFLRLWSQPYPNHSPGYPDAWLYKVCRNLAIDYIRKQKPQTSVDNIEDIMISPCIEESLLEASKILQCIKTLSKPEQEVLILKFCEDLNYQEISEITGLSVSSVGLKIHTGIKAIRELVERDYAKALKGSANDK